MEPQKGAQKPRLYVHNDKLLCIRDADFETVLTRRLPLLRPWAERGWAALDGESRLRFSKVNDFPSD